MNKEKRKKTLVLQKGKEMDKGEKGRMIEWIHDLLYRRSCCVMPLQSLSRFLWPSVRCSQPLSFAYSESVSLSFSVFRLVFPLFRTLFILFFYFFLSTLGTTWMDINGWISLGFYGKKEKKKKYKEWCTYKYICIYTWINSSSFYIEKKVLFM